MKIYKSQYGWSTTAHSKKMDGSTIKYYMDINFKKGEEPLVEEIEGKLIFRQDDGTERECFLSSYEKKGIPTPKLVMMGKGRAETKIDPNVEIKPEELPFY